MLMPLKKTYDCAGCGKKHEDRSAVVRCGAHYGNVTLAEAYICATRDKACAINFALGAMGTLAAKGAACARDHWDAHTMTECDCNQTHDDPPGQP